MAIHESSVNFENLIKDLADMYPYDVGIVVLVELLANALDSKANSIEVEYNSKEKSLTVIDNGTGMTKESFAQYHDFAAGLKTRGSGIGFAGVGAKISFNIANQVITETRSKSFSGGSNWYFNTEKKLIWEDIPSPNNLKYGTKVKVIFREEVNIPFNNHTDIVTLIQQHYLPLIDLNFLPLYEKLDFYKKELRFIVNKKEISEFNFKTEFDLSDIHEFYPTSKGGKIGYGILGISSKEYPMGENQCGVLLCTHGKVIKSDLFNQFPGDLGPKIVGVVEIPDLINFLTSSKTDFMRRGKHKEFETLYNPIRQEFKSWLKKLGIKSSEIPPDDEAIKLEKEIKKLIDEIPELSEFFGMPLQKEVLQEQKDGQVDAGLQSGVEQTFPSGTGKINTKNPILGPGDASGEALVENAGAKDKKAGPISRTSKRGPRISFYESPEREELSWVDGYNIVINSGNPAYKRASTNSQVKRTHCMYAIANAMQKFLFVGDTNDLSFVDKLISVWGRK
ncbi:MAG: ATP-binding protein [Dehalococcoidales bacterium]